MHPSVLRELASRGHHGEFIVLVVIVAQVMQDARPEAGPCQTLSLFPAAAHHLQVTALVHLFITLQFVAVYTSPGLHKDQDLHREQGSVQCHHW